MTEQTILICGHAVFKEEVCELYQTIPRPFKLEGAMGQTQKSLLPDS